MSKYKIHIDKPLPSDQQIEQYKDFDALYREYQVTTRFKFWQDLYKKPRYFAAVAAALAIIFLVRQAVIEETAVEPQNSSQEFSMQEVNIPFQETQINSNAQAIVSLASNDGQLTIPENAFVAANGKTVVGEIQFRYREIKDTPKEFTEDLNFNSLALLEIEAFQNGEKLLIAQGKSIEVAYVTEEDDQSYNVYQLNPSEKVWTHSGDDEVIILEAPSGEVPPKPQAPQLADASINSGIKGVIKQKPLKPFRIKAELSDFPELQVLNGINWVHVGDNSTTDPWVNEIIGQDWDDALVKKLSGSRYEITFIRRDEKTQQTKSFKTFARPEYPEKSYEEAMEIYEYLLQQYQDNEKFVEMASKEKEKIEQENKEKIARYNEALQEWESKYGAQHEQATPPKYRRTFEIKSTGIHSLGKSAKDQ